MKLPKKITKNITEELSPEDIENLNKSAAAIQPEELPPKSLEFEDLEANEVINKAYKLLCDNNISFVLTAILPKTKEERFLYRTCEIKDNKTAQESQTILGKLLYSCYYFMDYVGFVDYLESAKLISITRRIFPKPDPSPNTNHGQS